MPKHTEKSRDLYGLLSNNEQANQYYAALPGYVKDQISTRADSVNSFDSLCDYAENLLRGDD